MKMKQVIDVIISRAMKQGIDANAFNFEKDAYPSGKTIKKEVSVSNGLKQEDAKKNCEAYQRFRFKSAGANYG